MAKVSNLATRVYMDEFNWSGVLNSTEQRINQETPVVTAFSDAGPRRVVGNYDAEHSDLGFFDSDDDGYDEQVFALLDNTEHYLTKLFGANAIGSIAYDHVISLVNQPRSAQAGGAVLLNFDSAGRDGVVRGLVLGNKVTTGAESLTGYNQGVTTAGTIYAAIFRVLAFDGTDITLKIQESSDDAAADAYADIVGLTATFTGIGVERDTITIVTEAWKRLNISGDFTSATILVTGGVVQGSIPPV